MKTRKIEALRLSSSLKIKRVSAGLATLALTVMAGLPAVVAVTDTNAQAAPIAQVATAATFPGNDHKPHTVTWDKHSLMIDGKRTPIISGEFHYWRLPSPYLWKDIFQKMHAAGFNAVSLYFHWGYHSQEPGKYDFSGVRDIDRLLKAASDAGLYVIARPGPYIQAESSMGGLPAYMTTKAGIPRTASPTTLKYDLEWLKQVDSIIAKHQITNGGGSVIAHQVENEMISPFTIKYMETLESAIRANGITVPLFHNDYAPGHGWFAPGKPGASKINLYAWDYYPLWFNCGGGRAKFDVNFESRVRGYSPNTPVFIAEGQGGAFTAWGAKFNTADCAKFVDAKFVRQYSVNNIANGVGMDNTYMEFGGTNWGWTGDPASGFTSYDYGAAIAENRTLRQKFHVQKEYNYLRQALPALLTTKAGDDAKVVVNGYRDIVAKWRMPSDQAKDASFTDEGLRLLTLRHGNTNNEGPSYITFSAHANGHDFATIPQKKGTFITVDGRDATALVFDAKVAGNDLVYSTGQLAGVASGVDGVAPSLVLTAANDKPSETVLRFDGDHAPKVNAPKGVEINWDAEHHELRINAVHKDGLPQVVSIDAGSKRLTILLVSRADFARVWITPVKGADGSVLSYGADLVRTATLIGGKLELTGDTSAARDFRIWAGNPVTGASFNGVALPGGGGIFAAQLPAPTAATVPSLSNWEGRDGDAEKNPGFDDSNWKNVDKTWVPNTTHGPGFSQRVTMDSDEYGFADGDIWYRGHFRPWSGATSITVNARTGHEGMAQVWINGKYIGSQGSGPKTYWLKWGDIKKGQDNEVSILARNNGHTQEPLAIGISKWGEGLWDVSFPGAGKITWKIQGVKGGTSPQDMVRGFYNNGGSQGEREGWGLPGAPKDGFVGVDNLKSAQPGVRWCRSVAKLNLPKGQDTKLAIRVDDRQFRSSKARYRALLFVNGWQIGNYINHIGPQQEFVIPSGIVNPNGDNYISVQVTAEDPNVGPDKVSLVVQDTQWGGLPYEPNPSGTYQQIIGKE